MATTADQKTRHLYEFGPFRVDPEKELLLRDDEAVSIAPKAFQVLLVLMRHKKQVVTKDDLLKTVWPDTFVEEANLSRNIFLLRKALGESPQEHQYIVTVPGRGYRFAEDVRLVPERELDIIAASHAKVQMEVHETRPWGWIVVIGSLAAFAGVGSYKLFLHRAPVLTERDTVVIADFVNTTGDSVFNGTLRQGLSIQLEQSPYLGLISDQQIEQTLRLMDLPSDAQLTLQVAHDVCRRTQSAAYLTGSIASLGSQYVLGVRAVSCSTGDILADEQETAGGKEKVLAALDKAASKLREKLGESLGSVRKFGTPLEQATTPSLDALQAYTLGRRIQAGKDEFAAAVPLYQRAIRFDPNFSVAYGALGVTYMGLGETLAGTENLRKAYDLRMSTSEPERFYVESAYFQYGLGDLDKARQIYETWAQIYPRNSSPWIRLCELSKAEGKYEDALSQIRKAVQLDPWKRVSFEDLVGTLIALNRFQEAGTEVQHEIDEGLGSTKLRLKLYQLALLEGDPGLLKQMESIAGNPDSEAKMLELEAQTAANNGQLKQSHDLSRQAVEAAIRAGETEVAASFEANAALREELFENTTGRRTPTPPVPVNHMGRGGEYAVALSYAFAGDVSGAESLADDLAKRYPDDTVVRFNFLPTLDAQIALTRNDPSKAFDLLEPAREYELSDAYLGFLGPVYVSGEAYLMAHKGAEAVAEFQKILDHRGLVANSPSSALARLELGRAYAIAGDKNKARSAYQEFLAGWKDADPDVSILRQAKAEYMKLK